MNSPLVETAFTRFVSRQVAHYTAFKGYSLLRSEDGRMMDLYEKDEPRLRVEFLAGDPSGLVDLSAVIHTPIGPPNLVEVHGALLDMGEMMLGPLHASDFLAVDGNALLLKRRLQTPKARRSRARQEFQLQMSDFDSFARKIYNVLEEEMKHQFRIKLN